MTGGFSWQMESNIIWWRHQMETFSALLVLCAGNSPVTGEFPSQRPVTQSFDGFFDLRLNKRLGKQSRRWWFETPWCWLWRHCNDEFPCHGVIMHFPCVLLTVFTHYFGALLDTKYSYSTWFLKHFTAAIICAECQNIIRAAYSCKVFRDTGIGQRIASWNARILKYTQ